MSHSAHSLISSARDEFRRGEYHAAVEHFAEVAALARAAGLTEQELNALGWIPPALANAGEWSASADAVSRLTRRSEELGNERYVMHAILRRAEVQEQIDFPNHWERLKPELMNGLAIARRLGDTYFEHYYLMRMGGLAARAGEFEQGRAWLDEVLARAGLRATNACYLRFMAHGYLSNLMVRLGRLAAAVVHGRLALRHARASGNPHFLTDARMMLVEALTEAGRAERALDQAELALSDALKMSWRFEEQRAEFWRAEILRRLDRANEAVGAARRALDLAREMGLREREVECLIRLARAQQACGQCADAARTAEQAAWLARARHYTELGVQAAELIAVRSGQRGADDE